MAAMDEDAAYRALCARDARLDGLLYIGVTSTDIYCRPVCRVRTPRRGNCRFFTTAAQAEAQGFRPCLKCRPELAPGAGHAWSVMDASCTLARQAARQLDAQAAAGEAPRLATLAARLGISDRHLRRIFMAEHGVTPLQYLQTRRLLLAKQLLTDTRLPVAQVALASGFQSLRRFNAAFASHYRINPARLRQASEPGRACGNAQAPLILTLAYRTPFDITSLLRFFAQRAVPGVETVNLTTAAPTVQRCLRAGVVSARPGWLEAVFEPARAQVRLRYSADWAHDSAQVMAAVRRWLDLDARPALIDAALAGLPGEAGLRLPGSLDAFEAAVQTVLFDRRLASGTARRLAGRLASHFGERLAAAAAPPWVDAGAAEGGRLFPAPMVLSQAGAGALVAVGLDAARAAAVAALAHAWPEVAALALPWQPVQALLERLRTLPGIGPSMAQRIAMHAFSWSDGFPPADAVLLAALRRQPASPLRPADADTLANAWRPWRSYAARRLWNERETST